MSLRVAISTVASRPFTIGESQLGGPDVLGGWTASGLLGDIVGAAALRASGGDAEILDARTASPDEQVDALVWDQSALADDLPVLKWPHVPAAFVEILTGHMEASTIADRYGVRITVGELDPEQAVDAVADWLAGVIRPTLSAEEGRMIEVVLEEVGRVLEVGQLARLSSEQAAQLQGIYDTVQALTKVPRPPRRILGWAMREIEQIAAAYIAGLATTSLPSLVHSLH